MPCDDREESESLLERRRTSSPNSRQGVNQAQRLLTSSNYIHTTNGTNIGDPTRQQTLDFELSQRSQDFWGRQAVMQQGSIQHQPGSAGGHDGGNRGPPPAIMRTFIQRDFSEGTAVKFQEKLPEELNGKVIKKNLNTFSYN